MEKQRDKTQNDAVGAPKKARIVFVDYFKALLIISVVLAHINFANQAINPWLRIFNIPAFFFAAGFLLKKTASARELANVIGKRFRGLMIPYYLWGAIYAELSVTNVLYILYGSYNSLDKGGSLTVLWFLPVMFLSVVLFQLCRHLLRDRFTTIVKLAVSGICFAAAAFLPKLELGYPMGINVAILAFGFLLLGNVCFPLLQKCEKFLLSYKNRVLALSLTGLIMVIFGWGAFLCAKHNSAYVKSLLVADARYGHYGLFLLGALIGIVFTCFAVMFLEQIPWKTAGRVLGYLGQNSFAIYILHKPVVVLMNVVFRRITVPSWAALITTCILAIAASCLGNVLLNRYAFVLVGRTAKNEP